MFNRNAHLGNSANSDNTLKPKTAKLLSSISGELEFNPNRSY